jgi:hypothetical protein
MVNGWLIEVDLTESRQPVADVFAEHHSFNKNILLEGNLGAGAKADGHLWITHPAETTGRAKVEFG